MEGSTTRQVRHGSATTTGAARTAHQRSTRGRGVRPNHAAKSRPLRNTSGDCVCADMAVVISGRIPATVASPPNRFVFAGTTSDLSMEFGDLFFGLTEDNHKHTQPWPHHFGLAWVSGHDQSDGPPGFTTPSGTISSNSAMCLCPRSALIACVRCRTRSSRTRKPAATAWLSSQVTATKRIVGRLAASQIAAASALSVGEKTIHRIAFPFRLTLALDHRLHTGWQDPWYLVPELCNYPATEMSSATGFHRGKAARFLTEILQRPRSRHRCKQITACPASSPP